MSNAKLPLGMFIPTKTDGCEMCGYKGWIKVNYNTAGGLKPAGVMDCMNCKPLQKGE